MQLIIVFKVILATIVFTKEAAQGGIVPVFQNNNDPGVEVTYLLPYS